nr:unnamed protein product [Naegleria fowleri]
MMTFGVEAQKTYSITSYSSQVSVGTASSCYVNVVETVEYAFTGSYSTVARAVPYTIALDIPSSSVKVDVLTPGYSVSYTTVTSEANAYYITSTLYPSTPSGATTTIKIRRSYTVKGPITKNGNNNVVTYYYKEASDVTNLSVSFVFDSSLNLNSNDLTASSGGVVSGTTVTYYKSSLISNGEFIPYVSFPVRSQFDSCASSPGIGIGTIIGIIFAVIVFVICAIVCSIIGFFRRVFYRPSYGFGYYGFGPTYYQADPGFHHHHHHHQSGGHHHGGITGTSGFAH